MLLLDLSIPIEQADMQTEGSDDIQLADEARRMPLRNKDRHWDSVVTAVISWLMWFVIRRWQRFGL